MILDDEGLEAARTAGKPFQPKMRVVGCFVHCEAEMLLLLRHPGKPQPGTLGIPSGKAKAGSPLSYEMRRELREETGITPALMHYLGCARVRFPYFDFEYFMFAVRVNEKPHVRIDILQHTAYEWSTSREARHLNLIEDMWPCITGWFEPYLR